MSKVGHRIITFICLLVAVVYVVRKFQGVFGFWFNGIETWQKLFRPFPEWGTGPDLYGALLSSKWNGTRTMWYGGMLLTMIFFTILYRKYKFLAFLLLEGFLIELLDLFWLVNGKYRWGWVALGTDSAIRSELLWAPILLLCGFYLLKKKDDEAPAGTLPSIDG